jgi:hypothetical protein
VSVVSLPDLIQSVALLVLAAAFFVLAWRGLRRLEARVGQVHVTAEAVNRAVNNVGVGEPTLRQVVVGIGERLDRHVVDTTLRLEQIEELVTRPRGAA